MVYDPFNFDLGDPVLAPVLIPAVTTTISVIEPGKLFGLDEGFVVGIVVGILFFNFIGEIIE